MTKRRKRIEIESVRDAAIDDARATKAMSCLYHLMTIARNQIDIGTWIRKGGLDLEDLHDALSTGGSHPVLKRWKQRRTANRPPPDARDQHTRRLIYYLLIALCRAGLTKTAARAMVSKALARDMPTSEQTLEHWEREERPLTAAEDEHIVAAALDRCGHDHELLVLHFVGLIQARRDPFVDFISYFGKPEH